ncbi:MAG: NAD-binding protein [Halobacteriales archaeon]|nr:NAD-binding protein [Halobacteriales archaeon]
MTRSVLIVGGGRVGRHVAADLADNQYHVTMIERDSAKIPQLSGMVSTVIEGDGADRTVLASADPASVDVVAALTNDTRVNLMVCELTEDMAPGARTILRVSRDGEQAYGYRTCVDEIVYPAAAGAMAALERITQPSSTTIPG